jgi:hypothetical protein
MALQFDTSALISSCATAGKICIAETVFWGVALLLAIGIVKAIAEALRKEEPKPSWKQGDAKEAPKGFKWVLVRESDLNAEQ